MTPPNFDSFSRNVELLNLSIEESNNAKTPPVYSVYRGQSMYSVYSVYRGESVYSVYRGESVYSVYKGESEYSVYSISRIYTCEVGEVVVCSNIW